MFFFSEGKKARTVFNAVLKFVSHTEFHCHESVTGPGRLLPLPTLTTSPSILSHSRKILSESSFTALSFIKSAIQCFTLDLYFEPSNSAVCLRVVEVRATSPTLASSVKKPSAIALPMPREDPVIRKFLFLRFKFKI